MPLTTVGLQKVADAAFDGLGALTLFLYKNDVTPSATTVTADLTEADFAGYTAKTLAAATWADATVASGVATATYPQQIFTATAPGASIYGWGIKNSAGVLLATGRFPSPAAVVNGTQIKVTPQAPFSQPA